MTLKTALIQLRSGREIPRNIADTSAFIREAAGRGARFVATPEMTNILEPDRPRLRSLVRPQADDLAVAAFSALAKDHGLWLLAGSLALKAEGDKLANVSLLFDPNGSIAARYAKIHLFDVDLPDGQSLRESAAYSGGDIVPVVPIEKATLGLTICYDVRFPALYLALAQAGAEIITVPSAFTRVTGEAHWHVLLQARAIETGSYILAPAQGGLHESGRETFGATLAVSPWGEIIAEGGRDPGIVMATLDMRKVHEARRRIPALTHGRFVNLKDDTLVAT
ncbi:carbon-nitrogen hydrolase family protein [soil metagenome]